MPLFEQLRASLLALGDTGVPEIEATVKNFLEVNGLGFGDVFPILRVAITGTTKGPAIYDVMALLGSAEVDQRLAKGYAVFNAL